MGATDNAATAIATAARAMGLRVEMDSSRVSESIYIFVSHPADDGADLKIRVSRHDAPWRSCPRDGRDADFEVATGTGKAAMRRQTGATVQEAIQWIARRLGADASQVLAERAARAAAAAKAAATRGKRAADDDAAVIAAVLAEIGERSKAISLVAAGKLIDELFGAMPRARRQRLAGNVAWEHAGRIHAAAVDAAIAAGDFAARCSDSGKTWYLAVPEERGFSAEGHFDRRHPDGRIFRHTRHWRQMGGQYSSSAADEWRVEEVPPHCSAAFSPGARMGRDGVWRP